MCRNRFILDIMLKLFRFFIIYRFAKDPVTAGKIYHLLYHTNTSPQLEKRPVTQSKTKVTESSTPKPKSKKQEIIDSISYLKSKKNPTRKDKDSIYTLEMILKNM